MKPLSMRQLVRERKQLIEKLQQGNPPLFIRLIVLRCLKLRLWLSFYNPPSGNFPIIIKRED